MNFYLDGHLSTKSRGVQLLNDVQASVFESVFARELLCSMHCLPTCKAGLSNPVSKSVLCDMGQPAITGWYQPLLTPRFSVVLYCRWA
jgi:hypothetical protein